jgi:hypothetical protein
MGKCPKCKKELKKVKDLLAIECGCTRWKIYTKWPKHWIKKD